MSIGGVQIATPVSGEIENFSWGLLERKSHLGVLIRGSGEGVKMKLVSKYSLHNHYSVNCVKRLACLLVFRDIFSIVIFRVFVYLGI